MVVGCLCGLLFACLVGLLLMCLPTRLRECLGCLRVSVFVVFCLTVGRLALDCLVGRFLVRVFVCWITCFSCA